MVGTFSLTLDKRNVFDLLQYFGSGFGQVFIVHFKLLFLIFNINFKGSPYIFNMFARKKLFVGIMQKYLSYVCELANEIGWGFQKAVAFRPTHMIVEMIYCMDQVVFQNSYGIISFSFEAYVGCFTNILLSIF